MTIDEYKALQKGKGSARARTKPKKEKEADSSDISQSDDDLALDAITINSKAEYVTYSDAELGKPKELFHYFRLKANGKLYRVKPELVKEK